MRKDKITNEFCYFYVKNNVIKTSTKPYTFKKAVIDFQ